MTQSSNAVTKKKQKKYAGYPGTVYLKKKIEANNAAVTNGGPGLGVPQSQIVATAPDSYGVVATVNVQKTTSHYLPATIEKSSLSTFNGKVPPQSPNVSHLNEKPQLVPYSTMPNSANVGASGQMCYSLAYDVNGNVVYVPIMSQNSIYYPHNNPNVGNFQPPPPSYQMGQSACNWMPLPQYPNQQNGQALYQNYPGIPHSNFPVAATPNPNCFHNPSSNLPPNMTFHDNYSEYTTSAPNGDMIPQNVFNSSNSGPVPNYKSFFTTTNSNSR